MKKELKNIIKVFQDDSAKVMLLLCLVMLVFEYFGWQRPFHSLFRQSQFYRDLSLNDRHFYAQVYTSFNFLFLFFFLPLGFHLLFPLKAVERYGLGKVSDPSAYKIYLLIAAVMLPVVFIASSAPSFYNFYPLYRPQGPTDWLLFELVYMTQFLCVEFFFRGFGLFRLQKSFGDKAIAIMVLPYALLHIHKPFPEAIGSIFAGFVLGYLSWKGKSIWPGVLLHMLIALSADTFGLYHSGWF